MKRLTTLLLALCLLFCFAACTETETTSNTAEKDPQTSLDTATQSGTETSTESTETSTDSNNAGNTTETDPAEPKTKYAEDLTIYTTDWTLESLKQDLQQYVIKTELTYCTPPQFTYDLRDDFQKYSIFGYFLDARNVYECGMAEATSLWLTEGSGVVDDNNEKLLDFRLDFNVPYQTPEFVQQAVVRDLEKMKAFCGTDFMMVQVGGSYYTSFEAIPQAELEKLYNGTATDPFFAIYGNGLSFKIKTSKQDGTLFFQSAINVTFDAS